MKRRLESISRQQPSRKGSDTETTGVAANRYRSLKKPGRLPRRKPKNENMRWRLRSRRKEAQSAAGIADRETNCTQQRRQDNEQHASYPKDYFAKVEAELQKIYDGILAPVDKNLIPSARRIAGAEGHQQKNA